VATDLDLVELAPQMAPAIGERHRSGGQVRTFHVDDVKAATLLPIVKENIAKEARVI
jgi:hypothetical protein